MDWPKAIASESKTSALIQVDDYARRYSLSRRAVNAALRRQEAKGLVERVSNKIYINKLARDFTPRDLLRTLRPDSYVSLDSALSDFGVTTQVPYSLTCISSKYVRNIKTKTIQITFRRLKKDLYWGFTRKKTRYGTYNLAEPEKALLDWIYFKSVDGLPIEMDEFRIDGLDRNRLLEDAKKFSAPVRNRILSFLAETPAQSRVISITIASTPTRAFPPPSTSAVLTSQLFVVPLAFCHRRRRQRGHHHPHLLAGQRLSTPEGRQHLAETRAPSFLTSRTTVRRPARMPTRAGSGSAPDGLLKESRRNDRDAR